MWIVFSLIATFTQVTRNLFSKTLSGVLPVKIVTLSRFVYALPIVFITYLIGSRFMGSVKIISIYFFLWVILMASCQILATYFRVSLFKYKSFAVSLTIVQVETIIVAIIGIVFLKEILTGTAWIGILCATSGLILASLSKNRVTFQNIKDTLFTKASAIALLTGLFLALAGICAKQTFQFLLGPNNIMISLFSLTFILITEIIILLPLSFKDHPKELKQLFIVPLKPMIIGTCSGVGSFCWLTAYSLTNIAYVRTIGQLEFILATLVSLYYFKEKLYRMEMIGMSMVFIGSLILILLN